MKYKIITMLMLTILIFAIPTSATVAPSPYAIADYSDQSGTVDLSTGDMALSIPVFNVPSRSSSYPITLSYRSGIKVHDTASWVGLGWSLGSAGITRTKMGMPDDYTVTAEGNNMRWFDKYPHKLNYMKKVNNADWSRAIIDAGFSLMGGVSMGKTTTKNPAGEVVGTSESAGFSGGSVVGAFTALTTPLNAYEYKSQFVEVPSVMEDADVNGYLAISSDIFNPTIDASNGENGHDINTPDIFSMVSPAYTGQLVYGEPCSTVGCRPKLHPARASGNPSETDVDPNTGELFDDSVMINYELDGNKMLHKFIVTDATGNVYEFEPIKQTIPQNINGVNAVSFTKKSRVPDDNGDCNFDENYNYLEMYEKHPYNVAWGIKSIKYSNADNEVRFEYANDGILHNINPHPGTGYDCLEGPDGTMSYSEVYTDNKRLHRIVTPTHIAVFWTDDLLSLPQRKDSVASNGARQKYLKAASLYLNQGTLEDPVYPTSSSQAIKTVVFDYDYSLMIDVPDNVDNEGRLTLKSTKECGTGSVTDCINNALDMPPQTKFEYDKNLKFELKQFDRWGYALTTGRTLYHNSEGLEDGGFLKDYKLSYYTNDHTNIEVECVNQGFEVSEELEPVEREHHETECDDLHYVCKRRDGFSNHGSVIIDMQIKGEDQGCDAGYTGYQEAFDWHSGSYCLSAVRVCAKTAPASVMSNGDEYIQDFVIPINHVPSEYSDWENLGFGVHGGNVQGQSPHILLVKKGTWQGKQTLHSDAWSLTKVHWPTGGTTEWKLENDRYKHVNNYYSSGTQHMDLAKTDSRYGGGARVSEIENCDGLGDCYTTKYLYKELSSKNNINDFDEEDGIGVPSKNSESSGVATFEPGTFEVRQDSLIHGGAYSVPKVTYEEVIVIPGYENEEAKYGHSISYFTSAKSHPATGKYNPPVKDLHIDGSGGPLQQRFGLGFKLKPTAVGYSPLPNQGIVIGPKGRNLRFVLMGHVWQGNNYYRYIDVNIPTTDTCNTEEFCNGAGCACATFNIPVDKNAWHTVSGGDSLIPILNKRECQWGTSENRWCPMLFDMNVAGNWYDFKPIMTFMVGKPTVHGSGGSPLSVRASIDPTMNCVNEDLDNTCDLQESWSGVPTNQKYSGAEDKSYLHGLITQKDVFDSTGTLVAQEVYKYKHDTTSDESTEGSSWWTTNLLAINPEFHFPVASWVALAKKESMLDNKKSSTDYYYDFLTGLPEKVVTKDNSGNDIVTETTYIHRKYDNFKDNHIWSLPIQSLTYVNSHADKRALSRSCYSYSGGSEVSQIRAVATSACNEIGLGGPCFLTAFNNPEENSAEEYCLGQNGVHDRSEITYTKTVYDDYGNLLKTIDYLGNEIENFYGATDESCSNGDPDTGYKRMLQTCVKTTSEGIPKFVKAGYNENNWQVDNIVDENNQRTLYTYDGLNRLKTIKGPIYSEPDVTYEYNFGLEDCQFLSKSNSDCMNYVATTTRIDSSKSLRAIAYSDGLGRGLQTATVEDSGNAIYTTKEYNDAGAVDHITEPFRAGISGTVPGGYPVFRSSGITNNIQTKTLYDDSPLLRTKKVFSLMPESIITAGINQECGNGNPCAQTEYYGEEDYSYSKVKDVMGRIAVTKTDRLGRITHVMGPNGLITEMEYDELGQLKVVKDTRAQMYGYETRSYEYDALGRVISITTPEKGTTTTEYDRNGNVKTITDAKGRTYTHNYDDLNRLTHQYMDGQLISENIYDSGSHGCGYGVGRLCITRNVPYNTELRYVYDERGRVTSLEEITPGGSKTTGYGYDQAGNIVSVTIDGVTQNYVYDQMNRLESTNINGNVISYEYNPVGTIKEITYPNGLVQTYTYDDRNRVENIKVGALFEEQYEYDDSNSLTKMTNKLNNKHALFTYDSSDRLKKIEDKGYYTNWMEWSDMRLNDIEYNFDYSNNRLSRESENTIYEAKPGYIGYDMQLFADSAHYTYKQDSNELESTDKCSDFVYDAVGNMISKTCQLNLLDDGGFETKGVQDWADWNSCSDAIHGNCPYVKMELVNAEAVSPPLTDHGEYSVRLSYIDGRGSQLARTLPPVSGETITMSVDVKWESGPNNKFRLGLFGGGPVESNCYWIGQSESQQLTSSWQRIHFTVTMPEECAQYERAHRMYIIPAFQSSVAGSILIDNVQVVLGATNAPFGQEGTTTYDYDHNNLMNQVILPTGDALSYTYDATGRRVQKQHATSAGTKTTDYYYGGEAVPLLEVVSEGAS